MPEEDNEGFALSIVVQCKNQEDAARALEAFSRPISGLVLDGIAVFINRFEVE